RPPPSSPLFPYTTLFRSGQASLPRAVDSLEQAVGRLGGEDKAKVEQVMGECQRRTEHIGQFVAAYRQYCWTVRALTDLKLAPFRSEEHTSELQSLAYLVC